MVARKRTSFSRTAARVAVLFALTLGASSCGGDPFVLAADDASTDTDAVVADVGTDLGAGDGRIRDARNDRGGEDAAGEDAAGEDASEAGTDATTGDAANDATDGSASGDAAGADAADGSERTDGGGGAGKDAAGDASRGDGASDASDGSAIDAGDGGVTVDGSPDDSGTLDGSACPRPCGTLCCGPLAQCCISIPRCEPRGTLCPLPPVMTTAATATP